MPHGYSDSEWAKLGVKSLGELEAKQKALREEIKEEKKEVEVIEKVIEKKIEEIKETGLSVMLCRRKFQEDDRPPVAVDTAVEKPKLTIEKIVKRGRPKKGVKK